MQALPLNSQSLDSDTKLIRSIGYPPVPSGNMREVLPGGNTICGKWLPERVRCTPFFHFGIFTDGLAQNRLSVAQYTVYNSPLY